MKEPFYTYKFYKQENLVIFTLRGEVGVEFILKGFAEAWNDPEYIPNCVGITDIRNCELVVSDEEMKKLVDVQKSEPKSIISKWAILADVPRSVATLMLYEMMVKDYDVAIFTTWKAAAAFIGVTIEDAKINLRE